MADVIEPVVAVYSGDHPVISVDCRPLDGGPPFAQLQAHAVHRAASLMKLGVLVELARQVDRGGIDLESDLLLRNRFDSVVTGTYALDPTKDSDPHLYRWLGRRIGIRVLADRMIARSSNLATNTLFALLDVEALHTGLAALGAEGLRVPRGIEDEAAVADGRHTLTDAASLAALLVAIADGRAASPARCEWMRGVLTRQLWTEEIPAGLPAESLVGNKTGWLDGVQHDAALVLPPDGPGLALAVCTTGVVDSHVRRRVIRALAAAAYRDAPRFDR
ncbi:MAG: serine hydrolase [Kineosporiaceae bacterium]|nr:serine hydrolase [Kineosporiaceae bacterium]MBK7621785.1 serine hydrolase [Kineosporiaceae bacterium]